MNDMNDHPYEDISAFALGSLDDQAQRRVLDHADSCPSCAVLMAESMSGIGALAQTEEPRAMTGSLGASKVTQLPQRPRLLAPLLSVAALAASIVLLLWTYNLSSQTPTVPIGALVHSHFVHHQLVGSHGAAKFLQAADGRWIYVLADGLAPRARYAVFATRAGESGEIGTFTTDSQGRAAQFYATEATVHGVAIVPSGEAPTDANALHWP
ncbi:MAG: zf-HC2 domain-containing protein [Candidatus Eremiobacteraeota bacterium]|nr:zf-HC2 domain-containing protein [Candidatus Eremiobacteraeota bacterium]